MKNITEFEHGETLVLGPIGRIVDEISIEDDVVVVTFIPNGIEWAPMITSVDSEFEISE